MNGSRETRVQGEQVSEDTLLTPFFNSKMGGECYRYCTLKSTCQVTEKDDFVYQSLVPIIIEKTKNWLSDQNPHDWNVVFNGINALELQVKDQELFDKEIVIPYHLSKSLNVGWQHRRYGICVDPKYDIANEIMDILLKSDLKSCLKKDEEDNISSDLGMDDYYYQSDQECQSKGMFHYNNGISDSSWSPNGMYGGYDDWETYRDANGLDYQILIFKKLKKISFKNSK